MTSGGFWSYTHADDRAESERISELARDIVRQYELLTGESIDLFLDRDSLEWGNAWVEKVDESLGNIAFFIPVLTPGFFASTECRREMRTFIDRAERIGLSELIMPIKYVDFAALHEDPQTDDLIAAATKFQWEDWTELRFSDRASGEYRRAVFRLAKRLADANSAVDNSPSLPDSQGDLEATDDAPGLMDLIADGEKMLPLWTETVERAAALLTEMAPEFHIAGEEMQQADQRGKGFAGRIAASRKLADRLDPYGEEMVSLGNQFATQLSSVDAAVRAIIEISEDATAIDRAEADVFFDAIRSMAAEADSGLSALQEFLEQMAPMERMSRDLRRPFGKLRRGLTAMYEGRETILAWVRLIDELPPRAPEE